MALALGLAFSLPPGGIKPPGAGPRLHIHGTAPPLSLPASALAAAAPLTPALLILPESSPQAPNDQLLLISQLFPAQPKQSTPLTHVPILHSTPIYFFCGTFYDLQ